MVVGHRVAVEEVNSEDTEWENSVHTPIQQASTALTSYDCCSLCLVFLIFQELFNDTCRMDRQHD